MKERYLLILNLLYKCSVPQQNSSNN